MKEKNNIEPVLVSYLLEKGRITLPMSLMKYEAIIEIEKSLRSSFPQLSKVFKKFANNLEKYFLKEDALNEFIKLVKQIKREYKLFVSNDDEKVIDFLVKLDKFKGEFLLEIVGPLYFLLKTFEEMEKIKSLPKIIQIFIAINSYIILYELILHEIDRKLYFNLKPTKYKKYEKFFNVKRKEYRHAEAGIINKVLSDRVGLPENNDSIFGGKSETKIFRNKIAHANVFYDEEREKIIIAGKKYRLDEFLKLFLRLFSFLIRWIEKSLMVEAENFDSFKNKLISELRKSFNEFSVFFLKRVERGDLKIEFMNLVILLKKESGLP